MNPAALIQQAQAAAPFVIETADKNGTTTRQAFHDEARALSYEQRAANCGFTTDRVKWL